MKANSVFVWSTLLLAARASSDAVAYIFPTLAKAAPSDVPLLTPGEARLLLAHRLDVAHYHDLGRASDKALKQISNLGTSPQWLSDTDSAPELVLVVDGLPWLDVKSWLGVPFDMQPDFKIANPPKMKSNRKLVDDLSRQIGAVSECSLSRGVNPFDDDCWAGSSSKIIHVDMSESAKNSPSLSELQHIVTRVLAFTKRAELNAMIVVMPSTSSSKSSYGTYDMPSTKLTRKHASAEIPLQYNSFSSPAADTIAVRASNSSSPVRGVISTCFASLDACNSGTKNCSSHGTCGRKLGSASCFTCFCGNTTDVDGDGNAIGITFWGGGACQKKDVSASFWLIVTSTVVLVGVVSWAIGMLFGIGEEKLPGVIGAGVSSKSR